MQHLISQIGEFNPQLFREIKGRLKIRNILLAVTTSFLAQFLILMYFQTKLPSKFIPKPITNQYCTGQYQYSFNQCIFDNYGDVIINWQLWYQDVFQALSLIIIFALLVGGSYLLINDLATETRRDTLNFIRLTPQPSANIVFGKILGVPILLYIVILLTIPFHFWLGWNAKIPVHHIVFFDLIILSSSIFYYSGALLFGFVASWLNGVQAWLGSAFVLIFLLLSQEMLKHESEVSNPLVIFKLITPQYFIPNYDINFQFANFHWFILPLGNSYGMTAAFTILLYAGGTYFIWQSLQRQYHDPSATIMSKKQSYFLTTSLTIIILGCANLTTFGINNNFFSMNVKFWAAKLMCLHFPLFLYLIATLTPSDKILQDWARYQHIYRINHPGKYKLLQDLIWGEKSPALLAIAINTLITLTNLIILLAFSSDSTTTTQIILAVTFTFTLVLIYAAFAQALLLCKNQHNLLLTNSVMAALIILPPIFLALISSHNHHHTFLWLFTIAAPIVVFNTINYQYLGVMLPLLAILGQASIFGVLVFQTQRQLQKAGESATKALLTAK
jgi:hypothetical protein